MCGETGGSQLSDTQDIRIWAKDQGLAVAPKGPIPTAVMDQWRANQNGHEDLGDSTEVNGETAPEHFGGDSAETRPRVDRRQTWWGQRRAKQAVTGKPSQPRRVSIENVVGHAWGISAYFVAQNPQMLPLARCLDMQAPVAGVIVNDMAKGTVLDRALQPIARAGEKGEKAFALVGPPLVVGAIVTRPDLYPVLRPFLKMSMMSWMEVADPAMKKVKAREEKFAEKFGDIDIDAMIDALFAPPPDGWAQATEPEPAEVA